VQNLPSLQIFPAIGKGSILSTKNFMLTLLPIQSAFSMKKLLLFMLPLLLVSFSEGSPSDKAKEKRSTIEITTDYGVMKIMLYNETPLHRDNMLAKVRAHFYDSLLFHRVIR